MRHRPIRTRTFFLVLIPLLSLIGLYAFATIITANDAITLAQATQVRNSIADPTGFFVTDLEQERFLATVYLAAPTPPNLGALTAVEEKSDAALQSDRAAANSAKNESSAALKAALAASLQDASGLPALRAKIVSNGISMFAAQQAYSGIISAGYNSIKQAILQLPNVTLVNQALSVLRIAQAEDMLLRSQALLVGDDIVRSFPAADHAEFAGLVGGFQEMLTEAISDLQPAYQASFQRTVSAPAAASLTSLENAVINSPAGTVPRVPLTAYSQAVEAEAGGLGTAGFQAGGTLANALHQAAQPIDLRLIAAGGFGLLAVIVSVIVSSWIGRGLVRQLAELRQEALELAGRRLPRLVARLSAGEEVDVNAEAPSLPASTDEIGQVRQAFNSVQRMAVEAAVGQAKLREGVSTVFRNLARRSQSLLHQQLSVLDSLERRATEPAELEGLFRIDHLTTRMRRHAEGLLVLAGDQPARTWTEPVPLADVIRGAVAEVLDYARIRVSSRSDAALEGRAVADVIHMLAELAENATVYSPPATPVQILASPALRGVAVEIEDRGIGIPEDMMAQINATFAEPPPLNLADSERQGLYVAARLAQRHGIRITVRSSPFGGTTVIVLIPMDLMVTGSDGGRHGGAFPLDGQPGMSAGLTGRDASVASRVSPRILGPATSPDRRLNGSPGNRNDDSGEDGEQQPGADHLPAPISEPWETPEGGWPDSSGKRGRMPPSHARNKGRQRREDQI